MNPFTFIAPRSLDEALQALASDKKSYVLAGGTDLIVQLREGRRPCDQVVDLKHIPELMKLDVRADGGLDIGAAVPCAEIYENAEIARNFPGLIDAASLIGGTQVQSRASLGGNVCNASPAADSLAALLVLGTTATIAGPSGTRTIPLIEMFAGPGRNTLQPGELMVTLHIPALSARASTASLRFIPRNEMDIAVANAATYLELDEAGETIVDARVAIGAVAPTPLIVEAAAQALIGNAPTEEAFAQAAAAARAAANPISDMRGSIAQRRHLVGVLATRTMRIALQRIREK